MAVCPLTVCCAASQRRNIFAVFGRYRSWRSESGMAEEDGSGTPGPNERTHLLNFGRAGSGANPSSLENLHITDARTCSYWPRHFLHLTWLTLASNYVNILLIFVPLGIASYNLDWGPTATFTLNFLAIIPLASLLSFATEQLAATMGQTLGGLMNATFGNAVELIVRLNYHLSTGHGSLSLANIKGPRSAL